MTFDPNARAGLFTSRWWAIVSTFYLFTASIMIPAGIFGAVMGAATATGRFTGPLLAGCLLVPLFAGPILATALEVNRRAEAPLPGGAVFDD